MSFFLSASPTARRSYVSYVKKIEALNLTNVFTTILKKHRDPRRIRTATAYDAIDVISADTQKRPTLIAYKAALERGKSAEFPRFGKGNGRKNRSLIERAEEQLKEL